MCLISKRNSIRFSSSDKGLVGKAAVRNLKWAKMQLVPAVLDARAQTVQWEHAVGYFRAVEKERLGAFSMHSVGLEVSVSLGCCTCTPAVSYDYVCISLRFCLPYMLSPLV